MKLLLAEDDPQIGAGIAQGLRLAGFAVDWVTDGLAADAALSASPYTLLVLDLGLPRLDGLELLDKLRRKGDLTPVIVVTARDAISDRIAGLNLGADDYVVKPFDLDELVARVHALLRRGQSRGPELRLGALCVVPVTRSVSLNGETIALSAREFALLMALMEVPGAVVTLRQIEEKLYGWHEEISSNAVEVHLHRLRKKLSGDWIRNVRGVGYKIAEPA